MRLYSALAQFKRSSPRKKRSKSNQVPQPLMPRRKRRRIKRRRLLSRLQLLLHPLLNKLRRLSKVRLVLLSLLQNRRKPPSRRH